MVLTRRTGGLKIDFVDIKTSCYKPCRDNTNVGRMAEGFPYIGSLMSLVTHNAARYEGILSLVDMPNSSITLSGGMYIIQSFGWEMNGRMTRVVREGRLCRCRLAHASLCRMVDDSE